MSQSSSWRAPLPHRRSSGPRTRRRARSEDRSIPRFLQQSSAEIQRKFEDLLWHQARCTESGDERWGIEENNPEARKRNRYTNIWPWNGNRVRLDVPAPHSDYINASYIELKSKRDDSTKRYIACQGPTASSMKHMWRMIWKETDEVAVVVMLTKTSEAARDKCYQYFPEDEGDVWELGDEGEFGDDFDATVSLVSKTKDKKSATIVRKCLMTVGETTKVVWHLLFKGWPDFSVPDGEEKLALLELIKSANEKNSGPANPLIVHCSAGVGRSGTFITLDHFLCEMDSGAISIEEREDLVFETVSSLREQRMCMVQSQAQLEFVYEVLRERFQKRAQSASPPTSTHDLLADTDGAHRL